MNSVEPVLSGLEVGSLEHSLRLRNMVQREPFWMGGTLALLWEPVLLPKEPEASEARREGLQSFSTALSCQWLCDLGKTHPRSRPEFLQMFWGSLVVGQLVVESRKP